MVGVSSVLFGLGHSGMSLILTDGHVDDTWVSSWEIFFVHRDASDAGGVEMQVTSSIPPVRLWR